MIVTDTKEGELENGCMERKYDDDYENVFGLLIWPQEMEIEFCPWCGARVVVR